MQLGRHVAQLRVGAAQVRATLRHPVAVRVPGGPLVGGTVAPVEHGVAVVARARLDAPVGAGQMQLAGQAAAVAGIGEQLGDQRRRLGPVAVAVAAAVHGARIAAGQKAGAAGGADRRLAERVGARRPLRRQAVDVGRVDMAITERGDGIPALLIGADPKHIGRLGRIGRRHPAVLYGRSPKRSKHDRTITSCAVCRPAALSWFLASCKLPFRHAVLRLAIPTFLSALRRRKRNPEVARWVEDQRSSDFVLERGTGTADTAR